MHLCNMKSFGRILLLAALVCVAAVSCKKDDEKTSKSISGKWSSATLDKYISPLSEVRFELESTLALEEADVKAGLEIKYAAVVTGGTIKDSTMAGFTFVADSKCGAASVKITASCSGYSPRTISTSATIVDPSYVSVERDPADVTIDGVVWNRLNAQNSSVGIPYEKEKLFWDILGGYYTAEELPSVCPAGYKIPTLAQWDGLFAGSRNAGDLMAGDVKMNEKIMWDHYSDNVFKLTNSTNFSALPCGYALKLDDEFFFYGYGQYACYWAMDGADPVCVQLYSEDTNYTTYYPSSASDFAANVRCVRE